jgi:hypothetical protein
VTTGEEPRASGLAECGKETAVSEGRRLRAGEVVEVASKEEILRTLDKDGRLDGLPFMPEMFAFCGRRLRVFRRAHKTCDTTTGLGTSHQSRGMTAAVHLEGARCDGRAHGQCEAGCLIFWKEAWLKRVPSLVGNPGSGGGNHDAEGGEVAGGCTEDDVLAGTQRVGGGEACGLRYVCQATELSAATQPLRWWKGWQYVEDYTSGNVGLGQVARGLAHRAYQNLINLGIGLGTPLRWLYDVLQGLRRGTPYPHRTGRIPVGQTTPTAKLDLQPGEMVRVRSYDEILATCDRSNRNRGLRFDAEMVPYCGSTYQVLKRVTRIIDEMTGRIETFQNPCIILQDVVCRARYSQCRLFCPRSIYPYWREVWLERVPREPARGLGQR